MKTASRVLQKELTVPMLNILDGITDFRAFIIDAMEKYAVQARKDERLKVLEEVSATCSNSATIVKDTTANEHFNKGRLAY